MESIFNDKPRQVTRRNIVADIFATFPRIGLPSFGMAIVQNVKTVAVRRGFVSEQELQEGRLSLLPPGLSVVTV